MKSPWIAGLRSVCLSVPDLGLAECFYTDTWRLTVTAREGGTLYLRGSGSDHHLLALREAPGAPQLDSITLRARSEAALQAVADAAATAGATPVRNIGAARDPAGGHSLGWLRIRSKESWRSRPPPTCQT